MKGGTKPWPGLVVALLGALLCACGSGGDGSTPTPAQSRALHIPLASSGVVAGAWRSPGSRRSPGAWAIVRLASPGAPGGATWELLVLGGEQRTWSIVTPPGVSDAGGLVGSFSSSSGVVGVEASGRLAFSPMATTPTGGEAWRPRWSPGVLPGSLAPVPDAVAAGRGGRYLALFGASGTSLGSATGPGATLEVENRSVLAAAAGRGCTLLALTAVAFGPGGQPVAGGTCATTGEVGLFERSSGGWELVGPPLPSSVAVTASGGGAATTTSGLTASGRSDASPGKYLTQVLGIADAAPRLVVLVETVAADGTASVFRMTGVDRKWSFSAPFDVPPSQSLVATGVALDGSSFLLLSNDGSTRAEVLAGAAGRWTELPEPPGGTATLALDAGHIEALVALPGRVGVYRLEGGRTWTESQEISVPSGDLAPA